MTNKSVFNAITQEIDRELSLCAKGNLYDEGRLAALTHLRLFVDTLHLKSYDVRQLEEPSGLDEASDLYAEKHGFRVPYDGSDNFYDDTDVKASKDGFKAGAIWMANQGETHESEVVSRYTRSKGLVPAVSVLIDKSYKEGDKIIVQVRKKED